MASPLSQKALADLPDEIAPDGSQVRLLLAMRGGSMAHFTIPQGHTIRAVKHQTVDEMWYIVGGRGVMWRSFDGTQKEIELKPRLAVSIPVGTIFQVKNEGTNDLCVIGQTMPAWPGNDEAIICAGPWQPTVSNHNIETKYE
jgi:mannose-6-phosphate isomerase-like protein (cupin superfamily)